MIDDQTRQRRPQFWIILVAIAVALILPYFYQPFQDYLTAAIPNVHFSNVLFWFASLVGVVAYAVAHWRSFQQGMFRAIAVLCGVTFVTGVRSLRDRGEAIVLGIGTTLLLSHLTWPTPNSIAQGRDPARLLRRARRRPQRGVALCARTCGSRT